MIRWHWVVWLCTALGVACLITFILFVLDASGNPAVLPQRLPVLALVGSVTVVLRHLSRSRPTFRPIFIPVMFGIFLLGLALLSNCLPLDQCTLWGTSFRIQNTLFALVGLVGCIAITINVDRWGPDELLLLFRRSVITVMLFVPAARVFLDVDFNQPVILTSVTTYISLLMVFLLLALIIHQFTYVSFDPRPAQTIFHTFLPLLVVLGPGAIIIFVLSPDTRQALVTTLQTAFSAVAAVFALLMGLLAIPLQLLLGNLSSDLLGEPPTPTPEELAAAANNQLESPLIEDVATQPALHPLLMAILQFALLLLLLLIAFKLLKRLLNNLSNNDLNHALAHERESVWSWQALRNELLQWLPQRSTTTSTPATTPQRHAIRRLYQRLLALGQRHDLTRPPSATPRRHGRALKTKMDSSAVESLTQIYEKARYGPEPTQADVETAQAALKQAERSLTN